MRHLKKDTPINLNKDIKIEKYTVKHDTFDIENFKIIKDNNPKIKQTGEKMEKEYKPFPELHNDLYNALYKYAPELLPENSIDHEFFLNREVMDAIMESERYKDLRNATRTDELASTIATEALQEDVAQLIKDLKEQYDDMMQQIQDAQNTVNNAQGQGQGQGQSGQGQGQGQQGSGPPGNGRGGDQHTLEEAKKKLEETLKKARQIINKKERRAINKFIENATQQAYKTLDIISNWGLGQSDSFMRSGYQDKLKLLNHIRNSTKLKQITDLAGRYKRLAMTTQKEKVRKGMDEVYDIKPGDDISRMIPAELLKINHPLTRTLFKLNLLEKNLLQYEYSGKEKKHKGPIIVCIDESGSMMGQPEIWAKSVAMGMYEIAKHQKRSMAVLHFSSGSESHIHVNMFPKNEPHDIEQVIDMAEYFDGGGTEFEPPLNLSRKMIENDGDFSKADIIFITDGNAPVRDKWLVDYTAWSKSKNVSVHSIVIDAYGHTDISIKEFSKSVTHLKELRKDVADNLAVQLFSVM